MRLPPSRSTRRRALQRVTRGARHGPVSGINIYQHPHTFPAVRSGYASLEKLPDHLASFQTFLFTLPVAIVSTFVELTRSLLSVDYIQAHTSSWMMLKGAKRMKRNPHSCKSIQNGTFDTLHRLRGWPLTGPRRSFQGALRSFFQPIKLQDR